MNGAVYVQRNMTKHKPAKLKVRTEVTEKTLPPELTELNHLAFNVCTFINRCWKNILVDWSEPYWWARRFLATYYQPFQCHSKWMRLGWISVWSILESNALRFVFCSMPQIYLQINVWIQQTLSRCRWQLSFVYLFNKLIS